MDNQRGRPETYSGHAFHKDLPNGKSSGEFQLSSTHITFKCDHSSVAFSLYDVEIKMGGANDRLVFLSHPAHPDWTLYTADRKILNSPLLTSKKELISQVSKAKRQRLWGWSVLVSIAMLMVMIPTMLIFSMDTVTGWVAPSIPAEVEVKIGESAWAQFELNNNLLESPEVTEPLQRMIKPLLDASTNQRFTFKVNIVESSELNAFALPGGVIALNTGLILAAESRDEVLGVLAHEISHVTGQHGIRSVIGTAGIIITVQAFFGDFTGLLGLLVDAGPLLLRQSYSRGFESEADSNGFDLLVKAQVNPAGMTSFFKRIIQEKEKMMAKIEDEETRDLVELTSGFLSSHPETEERVEIIEEQIRSLKLEFISDETDFIQLQDAVRVIVAKNKEVTEKGE